MPDKIISIADDVFGKKVCFDFRKGLSIPFLLLFSVHKCHVCPYILHRFIYTSKKTEKKEASHKFSELMRSLENLLMDQ